MLYKRKGGCFMKNKKVRFFILFFIVLLLLIFILCYFFIPKNDSKLKTIRSEEQLEKIYQGKQQSDLENIFYSVLCMPFSIPYNSYADGVILSSSSSQSSSSLGLDASVIAPATNAASSSNNLFSSSSTKDYSTTNIQVENVDEADIIKTDGDYIYSLSGSNVIITDVRDPENIQIASKISSFSICAPEDLILFENQLIVIFQEGTGSSYSYSSNSNTVVRIYDITDRTTPVLQKSYTLYEPYYTSRCIGENLYVISSGNLRWENDQVITYYLEDNKQIELPLDQIHYLEDVQTKKQTLISVVDLKQVEEDIQVNSYLIDISNCYVSEKNIYLFDQDYEGSTSTPPISSLFGFAGAIGPFIYHSNTSNSSGYYTKVFKFEILEDGSIQYRASSRVKGKTINQYSFDEYDANLRLALYDNSGSRVVVLDPDLNEIGKTSYLAKGETMYSSRFIGTKAYLVTYLTTDPLYVIDLSDPRNPAVLGELKIPGYSTYLHPYDENHLIGIGMETEENIVRNSSGKIIRTTSQIVGMKMALFDVSDVSNPIQISDTVIGDRRTTSAILTNPKALLFSKEKELIAIPINNFAEDFSISNSTSSYSSIVRSYTSYNKPYIAEGYAVYKINLEDGFSLKGIITHENTTNKRTRQTNTKLLRGVYIDDNLFTVSESAIKVNSLDDLTLKEELQITQN